MEEANGVMNGAKSLKGLNGHASMGSHQQPKPSRTARSSSWFRFTSVISTGLRVFMWYFLITVAVRCPPSADQITESSPALCKPYFKVREVAVPILAPYYDAYVAPYTETLRPYVGAVDESVVKPALQYLEEHGSPRVTKARDYVEAQWGQNVQPHMARLREVTTQQYEAHLAQHVDHTVVFLEPYLDIARTNALQTYYEIILPTYDAIQPHVATGYKAASAFATETVFPTTVWVWDKAYLFADGTVWPQLRLIYVENVEPQLVRIGQRLGRYQDGKPNLMVAEAEQSSRATPRSSVKSSFTRPSFIHPSSSAVSSQVSSTPVVASEANPVTTEAARLVTSSIVADPPPETPESEERRIARETVAEDLKDWQEKFAKAADEGAAEIEERVGEISKRMIRREAKTIGKTMVDGLQETIVSELQMLRDSIVVIAKDGATEGVESGQEKVVAAIRRAGLEIKTKAQDVRTWRESYSQELRTAVTKAAEDHFMILDSIRDLALQKIGMKWAWMDGVTYKDWAKYHQLRDRFDVWRADLEKLVVTHPGIEEAERAAADAEDAAMYLAQDAAMELARLKQVGVWKLIAADVTDNFDSEQMKAAADAAEAAKKEAVSESKAPAVDQVALQVDETAEPEAAQTDTNEVLAPTETLPENTGAEKTPEAVAEEIPEAPKVPEELELAVETSVPVPEPVEAEPVVAAEEASPSSNVEEPAFDEPTAELEFLAEPTAASDESEGLPSSREATSIKSAFLGVAADTKPSHTPILDKIDEVEASATTRVAVMVHAIQSDVPASIAALAHSVYSAALSQASEHYAHAMSIVSVQMGAAPTPEPVHDDMFASVTSAYSAAVASARSRFNDGLLAAQVALGGPTPTPTPPPSGAMREWASRVEAIAASRLSEGKAWAESQYSAAKVAVGLATPTPTKAPETGVEALLSRAKLNYYAAVGLAHERYDEFVSAAAEAFNSLTALPAPTPTTPTDMAGSVSSLASVAGANVAAAGEKVVEAWDVVLADVSVRIYGTTPTPLPTEPAAWFDNAYSAVGAYAAAATDDAASRVGAVSNIISELLVGKEPPFTESVYSRLSSAYATASSSASSAVVEATAAAKEKVGAAHDEL